ncbi:general substrate transporter [Naematelia encephala]|uniref:General substrate transporter n=1 Tax=Naematelia encephala TaxID=71784 RepID=A0A1Y2AZ09_9TREE|nr:general substrate transporter [Naematelia encephala]
MATLYNLLVIIAVSIGSFTYGFTFGTPSNIIGYPSFTSYFNVDLSGPNPGYASSMQGAIVGVFFAGGFFGSFGFAWLADKLGRLRALQIVCVVILVSVVISAAAVNIAMLLVGRILSGIGGGGLNVIPPMFQSEISVAHQRGRNVGFHGVFFVAGLDTVAWIAVGCYFISSANTSWRLLLGLQAVSPAVLLAISFLLPESPRWLLLNGREEQAFETLCRLHDGKNDTEHRLAHEELVAIKTQIELDAQHDTSYTGLFRRPSTRRRLLTGIFLMFAQQSTGQNVLFGFQVNVLATLGLTEWKPLLVSGFYVLVAVIGNIGGGMIMDSFGRRKLLLVGMIGACLACAIHTGLLVQYSGTDNKVGAGAAVAFLFLFISFFGPGVDVTSYVYAAEIFPTYMRARGVSMTIATYFAFAALYVCVSQTAVAGIGYKFNIVFVALTAVNTVVIYYTFPETKGQSLEAIGKLFGDAAVSDDVGEATIGDMEKRIDGKGMLEKKETANDKTQVSVAMVQ